MTHNTELPTRLTEAKSEHKTALRRLLEERLRDLHPDLEFRVKDIKHRPDQFAFWVKATVVSAKPTIQTIIEKKQLFSSNDEYDLVGYREGRLKPYVLRKRETGDEYEAGPKFVEKVFSRNLKNV